MTRAINYKRPRAINPISVSIVACIGLLVYLAYLYIPLLLIQQETLRVLDSTANRFKQNRGRYVGGDRAEQALEALQLEMGRQIRSAGVLDPAMELWIEIDDNHDVRFGTIYSQTWPMPFDLAPPKVRTIEQEHVLVIVADK